MKRVLGPYLRRRVTGQTLGLLIALTGLMQLLELLDVTTEVLSRNLGIIGLMHYAVLRIPGELVVALPLAGLLGAMSTFHAMARSREITALRTAGVGIKRVLLHLLPVPLFFALIYFGLTQVLVPVAETSLKAWWDSTAPLESQPPDPRWVHTSNGLLLFERNSADGTHLLGLRIYSRTETGLLSLRIRAADARWNGSDWSLTGVQDLQIRPGSAARSAAAQRTWQSNLRPEDVVQLDASEPHLSSIMLADVIVGERVSTRPRSYYETVLLRSFTAPFTVFIMLLLAMPAAIVPERGGGSGRLLVALGLGLGFLLFDGIMSSFGTSGRMSAWLAAAAAPLLFAAVGFWQLNTCEKT
jgi:lipopolysaccharide export system permease protein